MEDASKRQLFEDQRNVLTFQDGRSHKIGRTCRSGEPVVEVPEVADDQQNDADISDANGRK